MLYIVILSLSFTIQGAQEVFKELPHEFVSPDSLEDVVKNGGGWGLICRSIVLLVIHNIILVGEGRLDRIDMHVDQSNLSGTEDFLEVCLVLSLLCYM